MRSEINSRLLVLAACGLALLLFYGIGASDIWNPNEGFYAEGAREIIESGDILGIFYNYVPRFQKPPMTYWLAALSALFFGLSEAAIRLPIVLCSLGTIIVTFLLASRIHGRTVGCWAAICMALSFQFVANSTYASPEVPLCFFFSLSLYLFYVGFEDRRLGALLAAYFALGATVLTKGFPFVVLFGAVVCAYLFFRAREIGVKQVVSSSKLPAGLLLSAALSFWWYAYAHSRFGDAFVNVQTRETWTRAFSEKAFSFGDLFFYPGVIAWGFLPYSILFFFAVVHALRTPQFMRAARFELCWVAVTLLFFTVARGKIPTYFIPAHPAMAIVAGAFVPKALELRRQPLLAFILPGIGFLLLIPTLASYVGFTAAAPLLFFLPLVILLRREHWPFFPYFSTLAALLFFTIDVLPVVGEYRQYDQIGTRIREDRGDLQIPVFAERPTPNNLPFYVRQRVEADQSWEAIQAAALTQKTTYLFFEKRDDRELPEGRVLWSGLIYSGKSESRFMLLLKDIWHARQGDLRGFKHYLLVKTNAAS